MKNYDGYEKEESCTWTRIESYCWSVKTEMYDNWSYGGEWNEVEVMEEFISHHSYTLESIFGL